MSESGQAQEAFTIGEVAERTGLSVHALRYYERENLLVSPVRRTSGGRRTYTAADIEWLRYAVVNGQLEVPVGGQ